MIMNNNTIFFYFLSQTVEEQAIENYDSMNKNQAKKNYIMMLYFVCICSEFDPVLKILHRCSCLLFLRLNCGISSV